MNYLKQTLPFIADYKPTRSLYQIFSAKLKIIPEALLEMFLGKPQHLLESYVAESALKNLNVYKKGDPEIVYMRANPTALTTWGFSQPEKITIGKVTNIKIVRDKEKVLKSFQFNLLIKKNVWKTSLKKLKKNDELSFRACFTDVPSNPDECYFDKVEIF